MIFRAFAVLALISLAAPLAHAQGIDTRRLKLAPSGEAAAVSGQITGYEIVDYRLAAVAGQTLSVAMTVDNLSSYFNILPPGGSGEALFVGTISGANFQGALPATGDYRVRVYLMRNGARRGETAKYKLDLTLSDGPPPAAPDDGGPRAWEVAGVSGALNLREAPSESAQVVATYAPGTLLSNLGCQSAEGRVWCDVQEIVGGPRGYVAGEYLTPALAPSGSLAVGPDDSALRAGQGEFDATGLIPCAQHSGQPTAPCPFGVARSGGGYATVVVTRPGLPSRAIFFALGIPMGADTSQADYGEFSATRESDLNLIRVGEERYEIPDAAIYGD